MSGGIRAPELDAGLGWLNTDRPLRIQGELRGQIVVLDFWTYCCINCMHILPDLSYLEHKYRNDPVTFIGVHSAKFTNEASRETIRAAILRYEIQHPVVIDDDMKIWRSYGVRSWPTVMVIDASGCVISTAAGEGNREVIDQAIAQSLEQGRAAGTLAAGPLILRKEASVRAASGLAFPGKVLADVESKLLFVADSNHNRIVIAELPDSNGNTHVIRVIGSGQAGAEDGPSDRASLNHPQGLAAGHGCLYIADTENHLIRKIDLESFEVSTIVGTGKMDNDRAGGGKGTQQGLNSPWDLVLEGMTLYVAMAGVHQIWRIDLPVGFARALAGSGRENIVDGPAETAALAQPSGICSLGGNLYFADSEVSAIRGIDMAAERVFTLIGEGLFSFGDVDGPYTKAKLQHPLGVAASAKVPLSALAKDHCAQQSLLVADTYNHKIKLVDLGGRSVRTLYGTGSPGVSTPDGKVAFFEPGGVSVVGDDLYVADTNNHRIVLINLTSGNWQEIIFDGLSAPSTTDSALSEAVSVDPVSIAAGRDIDLVLDITLPPSTHLNSEAPWSVCVTSNGTTLVQRTGKSYALPLIIRIPASSVATERPWEVVAAFAYCTDADRGLCIPKRLSWIVPVRAGGDASRITIR